MSTSYNSTTSDKNAQVELEWENDPTLVNPDEAANEACYTLDEPELEAEVAASILKVPDVMRFTLQIGTSNFFTDKGWGTIIKTAQEHFEKYHELPSSPQIVEELKVHCDPKTLVRYRGLLESAKYFEPSLHVVSWWQDVILRKARRHAIGKAFGKYTDSGGDAEVLFQGIRDVERRFAKRTAKPLDIIEFFEKARAKQRTWIVENWLASGSLTLFAGSKKLGKSTLLGSMISAVVRSKPWFGRFATEERVVVLVDFENPADYVMENLLGFMPREEWEKVRQNVRVYDDEARPTAITGAWLESLAEELDVPASKLLIFVDSGRAAFQRLFTKAPRWEDSASEVRSALQPLSEFCHASGAAIVLIHHDNKGGDTSGSTDWEAACDYVLHYAHETETRRVLSAKWGRWTGDKPEDLLVEKHDGKIGFAGVVSDVRRTERDESRQTENDDLLSCIPKLDLGEAPTESNTVSKQDVIKQTGLTDKQVRSRLCRLVDNGEVVGRVTDGRSHQVRYWRPAISCDGSVA